MSRKTQKASQSPKRTQHSKIERQDDLRLDKVETTLRSLRADVVEWLKFAETKNAALCVSCVTGIGIIITYLATVQNIAEALQLSLQVGAMFLGWSVMLTLFSFMPRLNVTKMTKLSRQKPSLSDNLEYYAHVAKYTPEQLVQTIVHNYFPEINSSFKSKRQHIDIAAQIIANARIALYKYRMFTMSVQGVFIAIIGAIVAYIVHIVWF